MSNNMKSQVTLFVILGLILLVIVGLVFVIKNASIKDKVDPKTDYSVKEGITTYIETCLNQVSLPLIYDIAESGGTFITLDYRLYDGEKYPYIIDNQDDNYVNKLAVTRESIQNELAEHIRDALPLCINLSNYRKRFTITDSPMTVNVTIGLGDILIELDYPLTLRQDDNLIQVEKFKSRLKIQFGEMLHVVENVVNNEIDGGSDPVELMEKSGMAYIITKHKPYPDTVFIIKQPGEQRDLVFQFGIRGFDTAFYTGAPDSLYHKDIALGKCDFGNDCFLNTEKTRCEEAGGSWDSHNSCPDYNLQSADDCAGHSCRDCDSIGKRHGDSWCVYDNYAGKGLDYAGSRHYRYYCLDGVVYSEECRDFREELCTDEPIMDNKHTVRAQCRINRWQDCSEQTSETECSDRTLRDCSWASFLADIKVPNNNMLCTPEVPPGFKFWLNRGRNVCVMGNDVRAYCDGTSCPITWLEATSMFCYMQGDCGNYRNIADTISDDQHGFYSSEEWMSGMRPPRDYIYLKDGQIGYITSDVGLPLDVDNRVEVTDDSFFNPYANPQEVRNSVRNYVNEVQSWDFEDIMLEYALTGHLDVYVLAVSLCDLWRPPYKSMCEFCENSDLKPCSEYRCRALGTDCIYTETGGFGHCSNLNSNDEEGPTIGIDMEKTSETFYPDFFADYSGHRMAVDSIPNSFYSLHLKTNEPAVCKLSYVPSRYLNDIPNIGVQQDQNASIEHEFNVWMPSPDDIKEIMQDSFNIESFTELASYFVDYRTGFVELASKYGLDVSPYLNLYDQILDDSYLTFIKKILIAADQNRLYMFVSCTDKAGNPSSRDYFVRFTIDENYVDTDPPNIIAVEPSTIPSTEGEFDLKVYASEPAECRYSIRNEPFDSMVNIMDCETFFPFFTDDGAFLCSARVPYITGGSMKLYILCRDNPRSFIQYNLRINRSSQTGIHYAKYPTFINISGNTLFIKRMPVLATNTTVINSSSQSINLQLNNTYDAECRLTRQNLPFELIPPNMGCTFNGNYSICKANLLLDAGETYYRIGCRSALSVQQNVLSPAIAHEIKKI